MIYSGFRDAAIGSIYQQYHMDIISNNLANSDTSGFKTDRLVFERMLGHEQKVDHRQGSLKPTGNDLDLAIAGDGFFQVQAADGVRLTRSGAFTMRADGALITPQGYQVLGEGGAPITLNPEAGKPFINEGGDIMQDGEIVGTVSVVTVDDLALIDKVGENLFAPRQEATTAPADQFSVNQGYLEASNVKVVEQMVDMIQAHRAFETYQKTIHSMQEIDTKTINQVGRVG